MDKKKIIDILNNNKNISNNKILYDVIIDHEKVIIELFIDNPTMHFKEKLKYDIFNLFNEYKILLNIKVLYKKKKKIIKNIVAIASGKGGVGKSTIAANISFLLSKMGFSVGLIDADIYGPSMPIIFNIQNEKPHSILIDGKEMIKPIYKYNIKILSIGLFTKNDEAIIWRGPMATKALRQFIHNTYWGDLDYLIIDLPPGTGDIHISMVQELSINGVVIVSTPQNLSLSDVKKAIGMFKLETINVPILGLIENMSFFTPKELPNNKYYIFGKNGVKKLSKELNINFFGEIPIQEDICKYLDDGNIFFIEKNKYLYNIYNNIIIKIINSLKKRNIETPPTNIVKITNNNGCS